MNRSVFALTLPAFSVLISRLEWDLSNQLHAQCFSEWLVAVVDLAEALECLLANMPDIELEQDVKNSRLWRVKLEDGVNVRKEPNLQAEKVCFGSFESALIHVVGRTHAKRV